MKTYLKYSIMITLTLIMTIGLTNATYAAYIGTTATNQTNPYESSPTSLTRPSTLLPTIAAPGAAVMYDGDTDSKADAYILSTQTAAQAWIEFSAFQNLGDFPITWVSLQIKYSSTGMTDDLYQWQWTVGANPWMDLTSNTIDKFDANGAAQFRSWSQLAEPTDGSWDWTDMGDLRVRILWTKVGSWDSLTKKVTIYEVWASAYSSPVPPTSSPTMSLQPPSIDPLAYAYESIFVEVYCNDVTNLAGWQYKINFDPAILAPTEYWNYYPWTDVAAPDIGADYINIDGTIPVADPLVTTGLTGNFAVARIYFMLINDDGVGGTAPPNFSWLGLTISYMGDPNAAKLAHNVYPGYYGTLPDNTHIVEWGPMPRSSLFPYQDPISTNWVEQFPNPGNTWHLTSWDDNADGILSPSDQIDMTPITPPGDLVFFHVEQIWGCDADPNSYAFMVAWDKGTTPEFPLGIGAVLAIAPAIAVAYLWRTRKKVTKQ